MLNNAIEGCTRRLGKAQGYSGLAIKDGFVEGHASMTSSWQPTPVEMQSIAAGAPIYLTLLGTQHPPVMMAVGHIPDAEAALILESRRMIENAYLMANIAHGAKGQKRETGEDYVHHPIRVSNTASYEVGPNQHIVICAALLHDVLEDTQVEPALIAAFVGEQVLGIVRELTNPPTSFGNRAERKAHMRERLKNGSVEAKRIKLADIIDNVPTIATHENLRAFAALYLLECEQMIEVLRDGSEVLYQQAVEVIRARREEMKFFVTGGQDGAV